jgi:DNA polymerase-3 subunit delta'
VAGLLVEEHGLSPERALLLARLSGGRLGWAVSAATNASVLEERDRRLDRIAEVVDGGLEIRFGYAQELATQFTRNREATRQVLGEWLQWWRDLMVLKEGVPELVVNQDRQEVLEQLAQRFQTRKITAVVQEVLATLERLEQNANPRLALEVLMLALPGAAVAAS